MSSNKSARATIEHNANQPRRRSLLNLTVFLGTALPALAATPIASDDSIASIEGAVLELDYLHLNDLDADGDNLTLTSTSTPANGTLVNVGNNHFRYTPNAGFVGVDSFTYNVTDGNGGNDSGTVKISVNAAVNIASARTAILQNVSTLADPTQAGDLTVWGPNAFILANYPGSDEREPMIAASTLGAGKVIAMPDHQWLNMTSYGADSSMEAFYNNGIEWLAGTNDRSIKVVTLNTNAGAWLTAQGYTNVVVTSNANLATDLTGASVFVGWLGSGANQSMIDTTSSFAKAGGGLFICDYSPGYSWWWNKEKFEIPANRLLREAGIAFSGNNYHNGSHTVTAATKHFTLEDAINTMENVNGSSISDQNLAINLLKELINTLDDNDIAYARLYEAFQAASGNLTPSANTPVTSSFEKVILDVECELLAKLPVSEMSAHRAALPVDAGAPRITNHPFSIEAPAANHGTKTVYTPFYAAPGETVTINLPAALVGLNLKAKVSHLRSGIGSNSSYLVMPRQDISFDLDAAQVSIANPHGGLIQIIIPSNVVWANTETINVSGAVLAPYFKLGETTDAQWTAGIRDRGTPFGVLDSPEATLVIDSEQWLRTLDDPEAVITEWNYFCGEVRAFYAYDQGRQLPIHHDYFPAGGVSTYPQSYGRSSNLTDSLNLKSSAYSLTLHEYGHICDSNNLLFHEFGETSPNLGGKWLQKTSRNYSWKEKSINKRINTFFAASNVDLWNNYNHYGVHMKAQPFEIIMDEFGPAVLKDTVAAMTAMPSSSLNTSQLKIDEWIRQLSNRTGYNMSGLFNAYQLSPSASAQSELSSLPDWMPIERELETLTVNQDQSVTFVDPSLNDFSYDGTISLTSITQPSNGTITNNGDGTYTFTPNQSFVGSDSITYTVSNGTGNQFTSTIAVRVLNPANDPKFVSFQGFATGDTWTTVTLDQSYNSMVVVAQPLVSGNAPALVTRIRNATGNSFEVRLDRVDGSSAPLGYSSVRFVVVEEGVYNEATHGIKMEAVKFTSTATDSADNMTGTTREYAYTGYDHYFNPVVFGQVMSANDPAWSSFWFERSANRVTLGKHVGEDPDTSRADETIGYLVLETGSYQIGEHQILVGNTNYESYAGFDKIGGSGATVIFDRFPAVNSAVIAADSSVPWGASNLGNEGIITMQRITSDGSVSAYLSEDTLSDDETTTGDKGASFLISHYTGNKPLTLPDVATSISGEQTLIPVIENDQVSTGAVVTVNQPDNGTAQVLTNGSVVYTPNPGFTGEDSFTYNVTSGSDSTTAPVLIQVINSSSSTAGATADRFEGIGGGTVSDLTSSPNYPDSPSSSTTWTQLDSGLNVGTSYGHRIHGVIVAPTSGDYTFWIASDDHSQLSLSTDSLPNGAAVIASVSGYTGYQAWDAKASQKSSTVSLEAGKAYYFEILHKEGGGGDHVSVAWEGPGFSRTLLSNPNLFSSGQTAPFIASAPGDLVTDEDSAPIQIDLSAVFGDNDAGDSLSFDVYSVSNSFLVDASLNGSILTLDHTSFETGTTAITVHATDRLNTLVSATINFTINDSNPDSDSDGLLDSWEVANFGSVGSNSGSDDPDADGLDNSGEVAANTDPNNSDSDADGASDSFEIAVGSDPNSSGSLPQGEFESLYSWWKLDETSGSTAIDTVRRMDGAVSGAQFTTGKEGNALLFDGVDDGVLIDSSASLLGDTDFSLMAWVKIDAAAGSGTIIQQREPGGSGYFGQYSLVANDNGSIGFFVYRNGYQFNITTTTTVNDGNWHLVVATRSGTDGKVYIDGSEAGSGTGPVQSLLAHNISIGYDNRDNNKYFEGHIDDVRVYSKALTASEIAQFTNRAPVINDAVFAIDENLSVGTNVGTVTVNDPDVEDTHSFTITAGNEAGLFAIDATTGSITTADNVDFESLSQVILTISVTDSGTPGLSDTALVTVNISDVNEAPSLNNQSLGGAIVGSAFNFSAAGGATDPDGGDTLTFTKISGPAWMSIDPNGNISGTPGDEDVENNIFTIRVTDSNNLFDEATVNIFVDASLATISTGSANNITESSAEVGFNVNSTGGDTPSVTIYYGTNNGGNTASAWQNSISIGSFGVGSGSSTLSGLTSGSNYYFVVAATNSAGTVFGSVGSFATEVDSSPKLIKTNLSAVSSTTWTTVDLGQSYAAPVIIATPILRNQSDAPVVTRIRNTSGSSFEVKIERADGQAGTVTRDVSIVVVEAGVYTMASHGVKMEAVLVNSTTTSAKNQWQAQSQSYSNSYTSPVVVGQVMSSNDPNWSVFCCAGSSRTSPPSASVLNIAKTVCEDPNKVRLDETIGYIVCEAGTGSINGVNFLAGLGTDTIAGSGSNANGYSYSLTGLSSASAAAISMAGIDGGDYGWATLFGPNPFTASQLSLVIEEDTLKDSERNHTSEQVGYIVFE